jgi:starch phosphorylase
MIPPSVALPVPHLAPPHPTPTLAATLEAELRKGLAAAGSSSANEVWLALARATRREIAGRLHATEERQRGRKRLGYLSAEYLVGRSLQQNLLNLGLWDEARSAVAALGLELGDVLEQEPDPALGSGGLGRLAACFLDSLACLDLPATGYGLNYEYGLFRQRIVDGKQLEEPDGWRASGSPWLLERRAEPRRVPLFGHVDGRREATLPGGWLDYRELEGVPFDLPIVGWGGRTVHVLRLYSARALEGFDLATFQSGDHVGAYARELFARKVAAVLYPDASTEAGRELRLIQGYFFVSCALQDLLERHLDEHGELDSLPDFLAVQLNDTHPALAVAELVRLLVDVHRLPFDRALEICQATIGYTNHTLLPEALERWPRPILLNVLPRHLRIIELINARFLAAVGARWPNDLERLRRMSIIEEGGTKQVRMAHLAIVGSHAVNGVSELHSAIIRKTLVPDFVELWPERFQSKTNGISPRRWLALANPGLAALISARIGEGWITDLGRLKELEPHADDPAFRAELGRIKLENKLRLAPLVESVIDTPVDPCSLFDVQIKRIHEYKRQLLAGLYVVHAWLELVEDGKRPVAPRTFLFAGKAAPDYALAKLSIRFLCDVARIVNADPRTEGLLRLAFLPNYRVSLAERLIPAAELSEQISTAGMEASGTGNMKLALNGALTIGTLDGANIEIRAAVGEDNLYVFGLKAEEIADLRARGAYTPQTLYESDPRIRRVLDAVGDDRFCLDTPGAFRPLLDALLAQGDPYFVLADFPAYVAAQERAGRDWAEREAWLRRSALTIARMGPFSSDRTIREYSSAIWGLSPA